MTARIGWMIGLWLLSATAHARLESSVDATTISQADTLRLTLRADGANLTGSPDLDPLAENFEILSTQSSSQFRSINGQIDAWTTWTLLLKPRHSGTIEIPALALGNDRSQPIEITVKDLDPQLKRAIAETVFFETSYEPSQVYVQSQIVVTRKLFYVNGAQLYGDMPNVPQVTGAMVRPLGEAEHSAAIRDGRQYGLIEQRFVVYPERSGELVIPSTTVTGSIRLSADSGLGGRRVGVDVSSERVSIAVQPIPPEYPKDAPWLPATDVELLEDWPAQPNRGLITGQPSQRTLIVRVQGNAASAIPPLVTALPDSVKAYPDPPKLNEVLTPNGIVGTRTESTSLVATQPGPLTVPQVQLTWWNTVHRKVETATLPLHTLMVTGTATNPPNAAVAEPAAAPPVASATPDAATADVPNDGPTAADARVSINVWLAAGFAVALLGWAAAAWRARHRSQGPPLPSRRDDEARLYRVLRRECDSGDAQSVRSALDAWLKVRYSAPLADATRQFCRDSDARAAIDALNASLYQRANAAGSDASLLRRCVEDARKTTRRSGSEELPALYPST